MLLLHVDPEALVVRLQFQERPWDLYLCEVYTIITTSALLLSPSGSPFAILLILLVPGYLVGAALFPRKSDLNWIERIVLSLGFSISVVPLLGLGLNFSPFGVGYSPIVATVGLFTVLIGATAIWRRLRLAPDERLSAILDLKLPNWREYTSQERVLVVLLVASILATASTLAYLTTASPPPRHFTEFFVLGASGNASGYPTSLNVSQPGTVVFGIADHEFADVNYAIHVDLVGVRIVYNATSRFNETVEVNRTTWSTFNVSLADGQNWTRPYTFRINYTGLWKVQFLLFKDGNLSVPYRELHLYVRVI